VTQPEVDALWEIRNELGKSTADSIVAYAALAFMDSPKRNIFPPGDAYIYDRLLDGNSVIDNDGVNVPAIKKAWDERTIRYLQRVTSKGKNKSSQREGHAR